MSKVGHAAGNCLNMLMGGLFAAVGAFVTLMGVGVIRTDPPNQGEARWFLSLFGLTFFLVGTKLFTISATPRDGQGTRFFQWVQTLLSAGIVVLFGGIFVWSGLQGDGNASPVDRLIFVVVGTLIAIGGLGYSLWKEFARGR